MKIEIAKIPEDGKTFTGELSSEILDLQGDRLVRIEAPIRYELAVSLASEQVIVSGVVEVDAQLLCVRCADFFSTKLGDSSFLRAYEISPGLEFVDVTEDIREAVLLSIPAHPSCGPDEKGFCTHCGRDLNQVVYARLGPDEKGIWNTLDGLKL